MKWRPSGSACGDLRAAYSPASSATATGETAPPGGMRNNVRPPEKRIAPSAPQLPSTPCVSASVTGGPCLASVTSSTFSLPPTKNASRELSGDQNDQTASSVPATGDVTPDAKTCCQMRLSVQQVLNDRRRPSAEIDRPAPRLSFGRTTGN